MQPTLDSLVSAPAMLPQLGQGEHYMAWALPLYTREEINLAGKELINLKGWAGGVVSLASLTAHQDALAVVNNWRGSHGYPL